MYQPNSNWATHSRPNKRRVIQLQEIESDNEEEERTFIDEDDTAFEVNIQSVSVHIVEEPTESEIIEEEEEEEEASVPIKRLRRNEDEESTRSSSSNRRSSEENVTSQLDPAQILFPKSRLGVYLEDFNNMFTDFNRMARNMKEFHERMLSNFEQLENEGYPKSRFRRIQISDDNSRGRMVQ
jgi:hypothetical protein